MNAQLTTTGVPAGKSLRIKIPFLNTAPLTDVAILITLFPLWWILGVEQFISTIVLLISALKLLIMRRTFILTTPLKLMAAFLVIYLISGLFIVEPMRIITFVRNFSTYLSAALLLLILPTTVKSAKDVQRVVAAIVFAIACAAFLGALGFTGLFRPQFTSAIGYVLPSAIRATDYGGLIANRVIGGRGWFFGTPYFRTNSMFMFSTMYAVALAITLPLTLYLRNISQGWKRILYTLLVPLLLANLAHTTGRVTILSVFAGGFFFFTFTPRKRLFRLVLLTLCGLIPILLVPVDFATDTAETLIYARGVGSPTSRLFIYQKTLEGFVERPIFGWGTERNIEDAGGFRYPAGSHSYYLGTLYKQGTVGFVLFIALLVTIWKDTTPIKQTEPLRNERESRELNGFLRTTRWIIVSILIISVVSVIDLDATVMLFTWVVLALAISARKLLLSSPTTRLERQTS